MLSFQVSRAAFLAVELTFYILVSLKGCNKVYANFKSDRHKALILVNGAEQALILVKCRGDGTARQGVVAPLWFTPEFQFVLAHKPL